MPNKKKDSIKKNASELQKELQQLSDFLFKDENMNLIEKLELEHYLSIDSMICSSLDLIETINQKLD
ncbi:hypothetical protein V9L05_08765 [Bernardetia sp. Wsw4-3y2]|uniref:hypothetical protein n=1 Tax=Bernardetia sp. Wsw4-3y2 TaxID=3127471 RepID=UPI0030D488FF